MLYRINFTLITNYTFIILNWETYIFCKLNLLICSHKGQNSYTARPYSSKRRALRPTSWQDTRSLRRCRRLRDFGSTNPADPANYNACQPRASLIIVVVIVIAVMRLSWVMVSSFFFPNSHPPPLWQSLLLAISETLRALPAFCVFVLFHRTSFLSVEQGERRWGRQRGARSLRRRGVLGFRREPWLGSGFCLAAGVDINSYWRITNCRLAWRCVLVWDGPCT